MHAGRLLVIVATLAVAPMAGITGWYMGLAANIACVIYAAVLVTVRHQWRSSGLFVAWRGPLPLLLLVPLVLEVTLWAVPGGLTNRPPGYGLWALTLLLVGINEELTSRVVVLGRMRLSFGALPAVSITAALFGLQHLSAFLTGDRGTEDILLNVVVSACYGFSLAAFQYRYAWVLPLIILHAAADFTTILSRQPLSDPMIGVTLIGFLLLGLVILRLPETRRNSHDTRPRRN